MIPILVDSREQRPWAFVGPDFAAERATLQTGDYSIRGHAHAIAIERKSLGDFVSTVVHDWLRFRKELYRLAAMDHAVIVVEASVEDVAAKRYDSDAAPLSVLGRAHAITIDHGIPVCWWGKREQANAMAGQYLQQLWKKIGGEK